MAGQAKTLASAAAGAPLALVAKIFVLLLPPICLLAPKGTVPLLIVAVLAAAISHHRQFGRLARPPMALKATLLGLCLWMMLSAAWAFHPDEAFWRAVRAASLPVLGVFLYCFFRPLDEAERSSAYSWLLAGWLLAAVIAVIEAAFGFPILNSVKGSTGSAYHDLSRLNRGITALVMLSWPLAGYLVWRGRAWSAVPLLAGLGVLVLFMQSGAAIVALVASVLVFGLCLIHRKAWLILVSVLLAASYIGSPGLAKALSDGGLSKASWLVVTARERVYVWNFTADRIMERPLFGWGLDAGRDMPNFGVEPFQRSPGEAQTDDDAAGKDSPVAKPQADDTVDRDGVRDVIPLHPHNGPLQILLDLGFIGAGLGYLFLWVLIRPIGAFAKLDRAFALAAFTATFLVASTAYGLWQNQWLAMMALAAVVVALAPQRAQDCGPAHREA